MPSVGDMAPTGVTPSVQCAGEMVSVLSEPPVWWGDAVPGLRAFSSDEGGTTPALREPPTVLMGETHHTWRRTAPCCACVNRQTQIPALSDLAFSWGTADRTRMVCSARQGCVRGPGQTRPCQG